MRIQVKLSQKGKEANKKKLLFKNYFLSSCAVRYAIFWATASGAAQVMEMIGENVETDKCWRKCCILLDPQRHRSDSV